MARAIPQPLQNPPSVTLFGTVWYCRDTVLHCPPHLHHYFVLRDCCHIIHQLSNHHYIMPYNLVWYKNFKMINLIHMISILNFIFIVVFYATRWTKLDHVFICFDEFINQLNLFYICIYLYLQQDELWDTRFEPWTKFFYQTEFSTVSSEWNFYILLYFQFWCCFLYAPLIYVYFEL
jgi:hypothetical protein